jgi:RNA-directed DNA polymerase
LIAELPDCEMRDGVKVGADATGMSLQKAITTEDLAALIKVDHTIMINLAFNVADEVKYSHIAIPKRNGQKRHIAIPSLRLRMIQRRLLPLLEEIYLPSSRAHGYIKKRGLRSNAAPHISKKHVLNVDLSDFFGSITFPRIRGRLRAKPYSLTDAVATTIARLATCDGKLSLGSPVSPILSNILCSGLDSSLSILAKNHGCFYTRYADDLTFSSNRRAFPRTIAERISDEGTTKTITGVELEKAIELQGFAINASKSRLLSNSDRQEVCGVVCNEKLNTLPKLRREVRASLHAWRKFGLKLAEDEWKEKYNWRSSASFEISLRGKIEFIKQIRGSADPVLIKLASQFNELATNSCKISFDETTSWQGALALSSCCIHSYMDDTADMVQGSGFVVDGGFIVTNRHVVYKGDKAFSEVQLNLPGAIKIFIPVEVVADLAEQDLALLRPLDNDWQQTLSKNICKISNKPAEKGDIVWLTGWPNYNEGDDLHEVQGSVIGFSYPDGVKMFRIMQSIVFGNSGGPVFNELGEVVGVATRGSDIADAPLNVHNACVPARWVQTLIDKVK